MSEVADNVAKWNEQVESSIDRVLREQRVKEKEQNVPSDTQGDKDKTTNCDDEASTVVVDLLLQY